jgi:RNA polymerase sigma-70 factor (ECF subfamily)
MRTPDADQLLMQRFQEGDESAFELLVHKYQGMVLSLCRRYLGSRSPGVDDVAQETFLRIYRGRMTYEPRAKVKTWIYSVTVNACLNEIRRLRSRKNRSVSSFTAVFGDGQGGEAPTFADPATPESSAELTGSETARRVREAVDQLPEQQRLALVLSRFHHCSYEEVSAVLKTSVPAVKSLLTRARENLRRKLGDLVDEETDAVHPGRRPPPDAWGKEES